MSFKIITDTSANLPLARLRGEDVHIIPFTYYPKDNPEQQLHCMDIDAFDGETYYNDIRKGTLYNTSQITPQIFYDEIEPFVKKGQDVVFVSMSSGISGSFHSALIAQKMLKADYPDRGVYMVDTMAASLGEGIAVLKAIEYRAKGMSASECCAALGAFCQHIYQVFTVEDLHHLRRTGRLSNAAMILGTVLQIRPILKGNERGQIVCTQKVRGNQTAINTLAEKYNALVKNPQEQIVGIAHANNPEGAKQLAELISAQKPPKEILTVCYEPVTGSHVGPSTIALFFTGDEDVRLR
jgi:DegV family protein with EDD domain